MDITQTRHSNRQLFANWKIRNLSDQEILEELNRQGLDSAGAVETLGLYRKFINDQKQSTDFILTGIGAFIGFLSCVFTMLDLDPSMRGFMLYGLTSIGLVFIFAGLFLVFE